jgi:hypothetical protein
MVSANDAKTPADAKIPADAKGSDPAAVERRAVELAQAQLEAYNARDIDRFMACFTADVEVRMQHTDTLLSTGQPAMRANYAKMFAASPELHCELVKRIACGRWVIDEELIAGRTPEEKVRAVAIYETAPEGIKRVWFCKP